LLISTKLQINLLWIILWELSQSYRNAQQTSLIEGIFALFFHSDCLQKNLPTTKFCAKLFA
jgi:hypothetical protein